ncbi:MAG: hypothetical protein DRP66_00200 [Planctomycetota bacterium]|nr:MAG: hypothetical protein DRP66_00200 [Planctomycetota bacterium]
MNPRNPWFCATISPTCRDASKWRRPFGYARAGPDDVGLSLRSKRPLAVDWQFANTDARINLEKLCPETLF